MIEQAPWVFVAMVVLIGGGGLILGRVWQKGVVANLESRVALRDDRIAEYERKLDVSSPDEASRRIAALEDRLAKLGPRKLIKEQTDILKRELRAAPGKVSLTRDMGTNDAIRVFEQLSAVFNESGWAVQTGMVMGLGYHPKSGTMVLTKTGPTLSQAALTVTSAFTLAGVPFDLQKLPADNGSHVEVLQIIVTNPFPDPD